MAGARGIKARFKTLDVRGPSFVEIAIRAPSGARVTAEASLNMTYYIGADAEDSMAGSRYHTLGTYVLPAAEALRIAQFLTWVVPEMTARIERARTRAGGDELEETEAPAPTAPTSAMVPPQFLCEGCGIRFTDVRSRSDADADLCNVCYRQWEENHY